MLHKIALAKSETRMETTATIFSFIKRGEFVSVRNALNVIQNIAVWQLWSIFIRHYTLQCKTEICFVCVSICYVSIQLCIVCVILSSFMASGLNYLSDSSFLRLLAKIDSLSCYYGSCCCRLFGIAFFHSISVKIEPLIFKTIFFPVEGLSSRSSQCRVFVGLNIHICHLQV